MFQLILLALLSVSFASSSRNAAQITFDILQHGDQQMDFGSARDLIVFLGISGSGKSTLVHLLAGDNHKLYGKLIDGLVYVYVDDSDKIGVPTINSKTLIPELTIDSETNAAFIDCPGFYDTRNHSLDIAGGYFIKKVFDKSERVKIVLTLPYTSVKSGFDRRGLTDLLTYVVTLIRDVDKFKGGIALIVTKVDSLQRDTEIIPNIKQFLSDARQVLRERIEESQKVLITRKMIQLIDIVLDNGLIGDKLEENSTLVDRNFKIGLFRTPNFEGPVSRSEILQEERTTMRKIILQNLKFIDKNDTDFNYEISTESKLYIKNSLLKVVDEQVHTSIENETNNVKESFRQILGSSNITNIHKKVTEGKIEFENLHNLVIIANISSSNIVQNYFQLFIKLLQNSTSNQLNNIERNNSIFTNQNELNSFMQYSTSFRDIIQDNSTAYLQIWLAPIFDFEKYLKQLEIWYVFLTDFYVSFPTYQVQKNKLEHINKFKGQNITDINIEIFLYAMTEMTLPNSNIMDIFIHSNFSNIDHFIYRDINKVLRLACYFQISCASHGIRLRTYAATLSEIITKFHQNPCPQPVKNVTIFVLDTIFINTDVNFTAMGIDLLIFARKWEVIGESRKISLDGMNAQIHKIKHAPDGNKIDKNGKNGEAGMNGQSAHNFYGIGFEFINGQNLTVSAIGGNGSDGQNGGSGMKGEIGEHPNITIARTDSELVGLMRNYLYRNNLTWDFRKIRDDQLKSIMNRNRRILSIYANLVKINLTYDVESSEGTSGSSGGHGGKFGHGGSAGNIQLIELNENSNITLKPINGSDGKKGLGGEGGRSGYKTISIIRCKLENGTGSSVVEMINCWEDDRIKIYYTNGLNGVDNYMGLLQYNPVNEVIDKLSVVAIIREYLNFCTKMKKYLLNLELFDIFLTKLVQFQGNLVQ